MPFKDKEKKREWCREWARKNKDKVKKYALSHPEKFRESAARYRKNHPDREKIKSKKYRLSHPHILQAAQVSRRAAKNGVTANFKHNEWTKMIESYNHCCAYCGEKFNRLEQDHVIPLTRGGTHESKNIVPACRSCNASKGTKLLIEWSNRP